MDRIKITNLKVFAHHGVFLEEKADGQDFYVNAALYLDCRSAGKNDELEASVDYGSVCFFITEYLKEHTFQLIEAAAEHLVEALLLRFSLLSKVRLELCKPHAPIGLPFENVSVEIERGWHTVYLSVGSNMGERQQYLDNAAAEIRNHPLVRNLTQSSWLETKPYGYTNQADFLNGCLRLETLLTPEELLDFLHETEARAGRERKIVWGPRTLDLDILFYDHEIYESSDLVIPHADMANRLFVLEPLAKLCPNYRHPLLGRTVREMYEALLAESGEQKGEQNAE